MIVAYQEPTYPTVRFILRHRQMIVGVAALLPLAGALLLTLPDFRWTVLAAAVVAGAISGFLLQSYVEIIRIISDTLLPR
jgi:hypothetical protein